MAVLGGGVVGAALAFRLAADHHLPCALVDPGPLGGGASGRAAGIVSTQCWNDWDVGVIEASRKEYRDLAREEGTPLYEEVGGVRTAVSPEEEAALERQWARLRKAEVPAELVGASELARWYPQGRFEDVRRALHTPRDAVVLPTDLTLAYGRRAAAAGTLLRTDEGPVRVVAASNDTWEIDGSSGRLRAARLVVACGAWSKRVLATIGHPLPLAPYLTRACLLRTGARPAFPWLHDGTSDVYCRPFPGGELLCGDGTELVEIDPERPVEGTDLPFLENVARFLTSRFPGWADAKVSSSWYGICTSTPDRRPLLGRVPAAHNLFVATGFNGYGIMRAGEAARRLALGIAKGDWEDLAPCDPARFPRPAPDFAPRPGFTLD